MPTSSSTTSAGACRPPPIPRRPMPADHATVCGGSCRPPPIPRRPMPPMARFWCAPTCRPPPIPRRPMPRLQPRRPDRPVVRPQFRGDQCLRSVDLHDLEPVVRPQFRGDQCHRRGRYGYSRPVVRPQFRGDQCVSSVPCLIRRPVVRPQFRGDQCRGNTNPLPRHDNIAFRPLEFTERMRRARGFRRAHRRPRSGWESHRPDSGAAPRAPGSATTARPGPACPAKGISGRRSTA